MLLIILVCVFLCVNLSDLCSQNKSYFLFFSCFILIHMKNGLIPGHLTYGLNQMSLLTDYVVDASTFRSQKL